MLSNLKEILQNSKLDYSTYAPLPPKEEILVMEVNNKPRILLKQWEKLNYLRKNLTLLDDYIQNDGKAKLKDWLQNNNTGMSVEVIKKIGNHNNETGGITAYFLDLQNFYDEQEELYDKMELDAKLHDDLEVSIPKMREERIEKRKNRRKTRKIAHKDLKADKKGYLNIVLDSEEIPEAVFNSDGAGTNNTGGARPNDNLTPEQKVEVKKAANNAGKVLIWIAGITVAISTVYVITKKEE